MRRRNQHNACSVCDGLAGGGEKWEQIFEMQQPGAAALPRTQMGGSRAKLQFRNSVQAGPQAANLHVHRVNNVRHVHKSGKCNIVTFFLTPDLAECATCVYYIYVQTSRGCIFSGRRQNECSNVPSKSFTISSVVLDEEAEAVKLFSIPLSFCSLSESGFSGINERTNERRRISVKMCLKEVAHLLLPG